MAEQDLCEITETGLYNLLPLSKIPQFHNLKLYLIIDGVNTFTPYQNISLSDTLNSHFINLLNLLSNKPELARKIILEPNAIDQGEKLVKLTRIREKFRCNFNGNIYETSTKLPIHKFNGDILGCGANLLSDKRNRIELWPVYLEKCYAQFLGSFDKISPNVGISQNSMNLTLNQPFNTVSISPEKVLHDIMPPHKFYQIVNERTGIYGSSAKLERWLNSSEKETIEKSILVMSSVRVGFCDVFENCISLGIRRPGEISVVSRSCVLVEVASALKFCGLLGWDKIENNKVPVEYTWIYKRLESWSSEFRFNKNNKNIVCLTTNEVFRIFKSLCLITMEDSGSVDARSVDTFDSDGIFDTTVMPSCDVKRLTANAKPNMVIMPISQTSLIIPQKSYDTSVLLCYYTCSITFKTTEVLYLNFGHFVAKKNKMVF